MAKPVIAPFNIFAFGCDFIIEGVPTNINVFFVQKNIKKCCSYIDTLMSGSPIIQNGMLVGAVTHVFLNDPTMGYGVFAEKRGFFLLYHNIKKDRKNYI